MPEIMDDDEFEAIQSNWMKFENIGDFITGTLTGTFDKEWGDDLPDQIIYQCVNCTVNGEVQDPTVEWNVGIKARSTFVNSRMAKVKHGQKFKIVFEKEIPPTKKGMNPAKSLTPYAGKMDNAYLQAKNSDDVFSEMIP